MGIGDGEITITHHKACASERETRAVGRFEGAHQDDGGFDSRYSVSKSCRRCLRRRYKGHQ